MNTAEAAGITLRWFGVSLATSSLSFLITSFYVYKYRSTKAAIIAGSASLSTLASLIFDAICMSALFNMDVQTAVLNALFAVERAFAFLTIFYAFHCIIRNAGQGHKLVVYVGYAWMVVTVAVSIAVSVFTVDDLYNRPLAKTNSSLLHLRLLLSYSNWGFIAVTLLIYFMNTKYFNRKAGSTMLAFIGLHLISAITSISINYSTTDNIMLLNAIVFFFSNLLLKIAVIISACYGSTWIQDTSNKNYIIDNTESEDLEANPNH
ncbi:hypothetical protein MFLAVUS_006393 [Mucor flavus]|uniref:Uncharacterized protein n=1 Tax=Mucor flavus TaxID=439312 RepID=A0ABP9Z1G1_9FUNG